MGQEKVTRPKNLQAIMMMMMMMVMVVMMATTNVWVYCILTRPKNIVFFGCDAV